MVFDSDLYQFDTCVFVNGSFHWASKKDYIVSFNLKDEELGLIKVPNHNDAAICHALELTAATEKSLAMMYRRLEMRVMSVNDVQEHCRLPYKSRYLYSASYMEDYVMINKPEKRIYLYDLSTGKKKKIQTTSETWDLYGLYNFVETLTPTRYVAE